jgi:hypothetical protein
MPKNNVSDPITDQEIAFAHLILSGTKNDRSAAEAVGLNPDTAAYTKAKPRVRAYMSEHRAAVNEKLINQEADGLRNLNLGRDQILTRLWELANLSHEVTRGIIAGQIKALAMIIAIEGLIPSGTTNGRRPSPSGTQPAPPPVNSQIDNSAWSREPQHQTVGEQPGDPVAATKTSSAAPQIPNLKHAPKPIPNPVPTPANGMSFPNLDRNQPSVLNPFINPVSPNWGPAATDLVFDAVLDSPSSLRLSFAPETGFPARRRGSR